MKITNLQHQILGMNCTKMCLVAGLRLDPMGSYIAVPDRLSVMRERGMKGLGIRRKGKGFWMEGREGGREGR